MSFVIIAANHDEEAYMPTIERLYEQLDRLLADYERVKKENESLRTKLVTAEAECEAKGAHIELLEDQLCAKQNAIETVGEKIRNVLDL